MRESDAIAALRWCERDTRDNRAQLRPPLGTRGCLASLGDVVRNGFFCYPAFVSDTWLDRIRDLQPFRELLETARSRHESALRVFHEAGGGELS